MRLSTFVFACALCLAPFLKLVAQDRQNASLPWQWQHLHVPLDSWAAVTFEARNQGDEAEEIFLTSYFTARPDQQFGRRLWVPANASREGWYLVKTPPSEGQPSQGRAPDYEPKELNSLLIRRRGAIESSVPTQSGERYDSSFIRCKKEAFQTLLLMDSDDDEMKPLVTAARILVEGRNPEAFQISASGTLPPSAAALEGWTHIILATDRILDDRAAVEALREWTIAGGRLWILLDKARLESVRPFLGDSTGLTLVDRVGLTSFQLASQRTGMRVSNERCELETPVDLVRVVSDGWDVLYQVDGWDAALSTPVGSGELFTTTLGPRGWLQSEERIPPKNRRKDLSESGYPTEECLSLGGMFWGLKEPEPPPELARIATSYVGYRVTSLVWVVSVLSIFCVSVLVVALVLWRSERLAWLAWIAPAAAVVATICLGVSGHLKRTTIPPTEVAIQVAEADALGSVRIEGGMSVYSVTTGDTNPEVTRGGQLEFLNPPMGESKRLVWSDYGKSHWENLSLNTGIHEFRFESFASRVPSVAVMTWDDQGVTGRITGGGWDLPERGLIVSPTRQFAAPRFVEENRFVSSAEDGLSPGQFSASDVIDDREQTRLAVLRKLFSADRKLPPDPRFYFWTTPFDTGLETQSEGRRVGDALVGLPIVFERPPAGRSIYCPAFLIDFRAVGHPGRGSSLTYNHRTRQWSDELLRKSATTLEFQLPPELGRLELDRLKLSIDIHAPDRTLQLVALDRSDPRTIRELAAEKSPVGLVEFELVGEELPRVDEDLSFRLGLDVGPLFDDPAREDDANPARHAWQIRNVWIEAWGKTLE